MSTSATLRFVLQHLAPAMLPPNAPSSSSCSNDKHKEQEPPVKEEEEYYALLGLPKYSDYSEIRKRYKQLSLQYHPDKVLQRGGNPKETTERYQKIQHAYSVLSDEHKRNQYHAWNCNVARYQFVEVQHGLSNLMALHENLTRASCCDKSRLMMLVTFVVLIVLLQPILIAVRVNGNDTLESVPWIYIGIPSWIMACFYLLIWIGITIRTLKKPTAKITTAISQFEQDSRWTGLILSIISTIAWWLGAMILTLKWDETIDWDYNSISIPFYVAVGMSILQDLLELQRFHQARASMVSAEYLRLHENYEYQEHHQYQQEFHPASSSDPELHPENEDDDDEAELRKRQEILQKYIVITTTTTPQAERLLLQAIREQHQNSLSSATPTASEQEQHEQELLEEIRVQTSPEYKATTKIVRKLYRSIGSRILTHVTTIALITAKVQDDIIISWWIVFLPIWISVGFPMLQSCLVCCGSCCHVVEEEETTTTDPPVEPNANPKKNHDNDPSMAEPNPENQKQHEHDEEKQTSTRVPAMEEQYDFEIHANDNNKEKDMQESGLFVAAEGDIQDFVVTNVDEDEDLMAEPELDEKNRDDEEDHGRTDPVTLSGVPPPPTSTTTYEQSSSADQSSNIFSKDTHDNPIDKSAKQPDKTDPQSRDKSQEPRDDWNQNKTNDHDAGDEEEAFRKFWEEMQRQAQEEEDMAVGDNVESTAFATISCCISCFQIMMLCLIVGKLEQAYDVDDEDDKPDGEDGYNAFWILFPVFVVAGLFLLCCACCIYAKVPENEHDDNAETGAQSDKIVKQSGEHSAPSSNDVDSSPAIVIPLATPDEKPTSEHGFPAKNPTPGESTHDHSAQAQSDEPSSHSHVSSNNNNTLDINDFIVASSDERIADTIESSETNKPVNMPIAPAIAMDDLD
jgi:hypothetical protein